MLSASSLSYYIGDKPLLRNFDLAVKAGDFVALVGPNGAGKSTALRLLCGELQPATGEILLAGTPLRSLRLIDVARTRACFEQNPARDFPFTVREITALGRHPHQQGLFETVHDHEVVEGAMADAGVTHLAERQQHTLSGGEATRAHLARVLAQEPRLLLLDEPTNHLDIHYQQAIMHLCHERSQQGCAVVAVLHDLNLAARYADRIIMLHEGDTEIHGTPEEALNPAIIKRVYGIDCVIWTHPSGCPWVVPLLAEGTEADMSTAKSANPMRGLQGGQRPLGQIKKKPAGSLTSL